MDGDVFQKILGLVPAGSLAVSAISLAVTAYFAVRSLQAWRNQLVGKRHFEVAEQTLQAFVEALNSVNYARNGMVFSGEGATRPAEPHETEAQTRARNSLYAPIERLVNKEATFAELRKMQTLFEIHFPEISTEPFKSLFHAAVRISNAAHSRIQSSIDMQYGDGPDDSERAHLKECRDIINSGSDGEHELSKNLANALKQIKEACKPYISR